MIVTNQKQDGISLKMTSAVEYISPLCESLHALCLYASGSESCAFDVQRAAVEALNNVVLHAYSNQPGHEITVCCYQENRQLRIDIIDCGESMLFLPEPILPTYDAESGRGWWIINSCVDDYYYKVVEYVERERVLRRSDNKDNVETTLVRSHVNILTFIKLF